MFFDEERILSVREMILSKTKEDRARALKNYLPHQKKDFVEIFKIMQWSTSNCKIIRSTIT